MNQQTAIAKALLNGRCLSIMTSFKWFGCTNLPRSLGRGIFKSSGVDIQSKHINFISDYGIAGYYFEYRLLYSNENKEGIEKMKAYIAKIESKTYDKKTPRGPKIKNVKPTIVLPGSLF